MRFTKWLWPLLFTVIIVVGLSACGSSLKKPTGLEDQTINNQSAEIDEEKEKEDLELDDEKADEASETTEESDETNIDNGNKDETNLGEKKKEQQSGQVKKDSDKKPTHSKKEDKDKKTKSTSQAKEDTKKKDTSKSESNQSTTKSEPSKSNDTPKKDKPKAEKKPSTNQEKEEPKQPGNFVTYSIVISGSEVPLPPTKMEIKDGDSVLQALIQVTMDKGIQMEYRGGQGSTAYIRGIANVYEFDRGQGSGWMYRINGAFPDRGAGAVTLCDGDEVEWLYTTNLGQDLDADLKPVRRDGTCPK